ncbi:formylglycine-generating enzyme required for sulfatase activity [Arthrobacter sp. V4I6]|uniref:SUMF1/EgtB/PvdO family nonheme iron enzyme n=1 Tax=unclassified Arthrobacter TaxID=235627 RepID=UPI00278148BA|nr:MULTISPECIES: SUMF1/EgtB/PvdO family nonheme iron enzyme [unclassified Arthrobacter]MDQ0821443.1 formylglycine-generating enzyme required for sulfatase activity [Arthrobacter sp. V1I7]MDQ0855709.1 formylglycine-generating enzyme required for sulfatase activity [Arthrobacter sp. V4I6]
MNLCAHSEAHKPWTGKTLCPRWQGSFPKTTTRDGGHLGTGPIKTFPPNGYGLYEMAGRVRGWRAATVALQ